MWLLGSVDNRGMVWLIRCVEIEESMWLVGSVDNRVIGMVNKLRGQSRNRCG